MMYLCVGQKTHFDWASSETFLSLTSALNGHEVGFHTFVNCDASNGYVKDYGGSSGGRITCIGHFVPRKIAIDWRWKKMTSFEWNWHHRLGHAINQMSSDVLCMGLSVDHLINELLWPPANCSINRKYFVRPKWVSLWPLLLAANTIDYMLWSNLRHSAGVSARVRECAEEVFHQMNIGLGLHTTRIIANRHRMRIACSYQ